MSYGIVYTRCTRIDRIRPRCLAVWSRLLNVKQLPTRGAREKYKVLPVWHQSSLNIPKTISTRHQSSGYIPKIFLLWHQPSVSIAKNNICVGQIVQIMIYLTCATFCLPGMPGKKQAGVCHCCTTTQKVVPSTAGIISRVKRRLGPAKARHTATSRHS